MKTTKQSAKVKRQHSARNGKSPHGLVSVEPEVKQRAYDRGRREGFLMGVQQSHTFIAALKNCRSIAEVRTKVNTFEAGIVARQMEVGE